MKARFPGTKSDNPATHPRTSTPAEFTIEEHLQVQREIEYRAHFLSRLRAPGRSPLQNWLQAEREVLAEFIAARSAAGNPGPTQHGRAPASPLNMIRRHRRPPKWKSTPARPARP